MAELEKPQDIWPEAEKPIRDPGSTPPALGKQRVEEEWACWGTGVPQDLWTEVIEEQSSSPCEESSLPGGSESLWKSGSKAYEVPSHKWPSNLTFANLSRIMPQPGRLTQFLWFMSPEGKAYGKNRIFFPSYTKMILLSVGLPFWAVFLGWMLSIGKLMLWTIDRPEVQPVDFVFSNRKWIILNWAAPVTFDLINQANNHAFKKLTLTWCRGLVASTLLKLRTPLSKKEKKNWVCSPHICLLSMNYWQNRLNIHKA